MEIKVNYFEFLFFKYEMSCQETIAMENDFSHVDHSMDITFPLPLHVLVLIQCGHAFMENSMLFGSYLSLNY